MKRNQTMLKHCKHWLVVAGLVAPLIASALPLNDTGITRCGSADGGGSNDLDCPVADAPGQDGQYGRDAQYNDDSDGHAGFSFTKLDANGNPLPASAAQWSCVKDNVTGLVWEVKTDDGGLRDKDWTYSWYNSDGSVNGGHSGTENGGVCVDNSHCDTEKFVAQVNAVGLCGAQDWRLPNRQALMSIVDNSRLGPAIDVDYFPNTHNILFWSSSPNSGFTGGAWYVYFGEGHVSSDARYNYFAVRLVRAGQ